MRLAYPRGSVPGGVGRRQGSAAIRRRILLASGTVTAAGVVAAACAQGESAQQPQAAAKQTTVSYWTDWASGVRLDWLKTAMPRFEAENPGIKVDLNAQAADLLIGEKLVVAVSSGTVADVVLGWGAILPFLAESKVVLDVRPYLKASRLDLNDLFSIESAIKYRDAIYGLPFQFVVFTPVYNKSLFQRLGVSEPTESWTWDDMVNAGKRLTSSADNRWGYDVYNHLAHWTNFVAVNGGELISSDGKRSQVHTPAVVEVFQWHVDLIHKHGIATADRSGKSFAAGNFAVALSGTPKALARQVGGQFELDVMYLPKWTKNGKRLVRNDDQPNWITIGAKTHNHPDEAFQFARWLSGSETAQGLVAETQPCTPVLKKVAQGAFSAPPPTNMKLLVEQAVKWGWPQGDPTFKFADLWYPAVMKELDAAYKGEKGVREACEAASRAGDAVLAKGYGG
jgi:multiple sugar transport system substrate-binding protein